MNRLVRILAVIAMALVLAACQVQSEVRVEVDDDGSGVVQVAVSLDDEALDRAGDLDEILVTDDLEAAGWTVAPPVAEADGLTWIRVSKPFAEPDQLSRVLAQVSPIFDVALDRDHTFGRTSFELQGTIDLSGGIEALGDPELEELFGSPVGLDVDAIEADVGSVATSTELRFVVRMPYDVDANGVTVDDEATWTLQVGDEPTDVQASASKRHLATLLWVLAGLILVLVLAAVLIRRGWRAFTGADLVPDGYRAAGTTTTPMVDDDADDGAERRLELIVLDGFGVLFDAGDDITSVLGPFVADRGGTGDLVEVAERYRQASIGRLSTEEFWQALGVDDDAGQLDRAFIELLPLNEGALTFLERSKLQGFAVACLANGLARWFELLRRRDSLDAYCETWMVSSDLAVRKPDSAAYEALREATGVPLTNCLMIDDRVEHLEAARRCGMSTALFGPHATEDGGHPRLAEFDALLK